MANDESRGAELRRYADNLEKGLIPTGDELKQLIYSLRKYVQLVVDRDAGPSDKMKAENTQLKAGIEQAQAEKRALADKIVDYDTYRESAIRAQRANAGLRESNLALSKQNADYVKRHDEMVDLYAAADQKAKALEPALLEERERHLATQAKLAEAEAKLPKAEPSKAAR